MGRSISDWGEYVVDQGLYGLRADNEQVGGNLQQESSIPAMETLDCQVKENRSDFTGYVADPLVVYTHRVTTEEVEKEEDQGIIDSLLGNDPETYVEEEENKDSVWTTAQERDFFDDFDLDGRRDVSYVHLPFTVGGSNVRTRGNNQPRYERIDIILPSYADSSQFERDLKSEYEQHGDLNRFAEALAEADSDLSTIHKVTENGGQFAPEGLEDIRDPRLTLEENGEEYVNLRGESHQDRNLEVPHAVRTMGEK